MVREIPVLFTALLAPLAIGPCQADLDLERARALWAKQEIESYAFTLQVLCFCLPDLTRPVRIQVESGVPVSRVYENSDDQATDPHFDAVDTVPELFDRIESALNAPPGEAEITYDPTLGYPTYIALDPLPGAIDDEIAYRISAFSLLP